MFEWLVPVVTSIVGAGAGTMFNKILNRPPRLNSIKEPPPESLSGVIRAVSDVREWQAKAEEMFRIQEREIRRVKRDFRAFRLIVDVFLVLMFLGLAAWFYFSRKP